MNYAILRDHIYYLSDIMIRKFNLSHINPEKSRRTSHYKKHFDLRYLFIIQNAPILQIDLIHKSIVMDIKCECCEDKIYRVC
jgi:hypothetical protein